jgi:hypothetical protein
MFFFLHFYVHYTTPDIRQSFISRTYSTGTSYFMLSLSVLKASVLIIGCIYGCLRYIYVNIIIISNLTTLHPLILCCLILTELYRNMKLKY